MGCEDGERREPAGTTNKVKVKGEDKEELWVMYRDIGFIQDQQ